MGPPYKFDIRKRRYETEDAYHQRIMFAAIAHQTDYRTKNWESLETMVDLCPKGPANRINLEMPQFVQCYYLEIKHVAIEDWSVPDNIPFRDTIGLSRRAGYIACSGDVLLSRFKEPLGKSLLYLGEPIPLVANTNFLLLRGKPSISPFFILGVLKSSFLARQLHLIIQRKSLISEMSQRQANLIRLPKLPLSTQILISNATKQRINLQTKYREYFERDQQTIAALITKQEIGYVLSQIDCFIDQVICSSLGIQSI